LLAAALLTVVAGCVPLPAPSAQLRDPVPPAPSNLTMSGIAFRVHQAVNRAREQRCLGPLHLDPALSEIALGHSADMARRGYFAHADPEERQAGGRAREAGYRYRYLGENLFAGTLYSQTSVRVVGGQRDVFYRWYTPEDLADEVVRGWLESPGHRRNLLSAQYTHEGIGVAFGENGTVLVTQKLSEPR
jgi:uncharacterized protein YkwD